MKQYYYALLAISCGLAYFPSIFAFNEPSLIYLISIAIGSVTPIISLYSKYYNNINPVILWCSKINKYILYPAFQIITRSNNSYQPGYLLNLIAIFINGVIWFVFFKILQFILPSKYDPTLCGWMVIFGGCITTIYYCGTTYGAWPFYPLIKRKYYGEINNAYPTKFYYLFLASGFILYGSTIFNILSHNITQIGVIIICIGYLIRSGTFHPKRGITRTNGAIPSTLSIVFHLGAIVCLILACAFIFQALINPFLRYIAAFPTVQSIIFLLLSSISQFPLFSLVLSIHSQLQSLFSLVGISGMWWSIILMIDLGVFFFFIEKKLSSYSNYGILNSRRFSIIASVSVIITIVGIIASIIIMTLNFLPADLPAKTQISEKPVVAGDYSVSLTGMKHVSEKKQVSTPSRDSYTINPGQIESLLTSMTNQQRTKAGVPLLNYDGGLASLAKSRSAYMAKRKTVDHSGLPEGIGENCAMTLKTGSDNSVSQNIINQLMDGGGHQRNILDPKYTRFGIGVTVSDDYVYTVQNFKF